MNNYNNNNKNNETNKIIISVVAIDFGNLFEIKQSADL